MTPEQRFFPTSGNDKLNVHDDVLEGQDAAWRVEARPDGRPNMRPDAALAGEIEKASDRVHGKNPRRALPPLLAMACALAVHAMLLAATIVWLGPGPGASVGPGLLALDLTAATMGDGGGNSGPPALPTGQPESPPAAAPPEARAAQPEPRRIDAPVPPPNPPAPSAPLKPAPPLPKKIKTAPMVTPSPPPRPRHESAPAPPAMPSVQRETPSLPTAGTDPGPTTGTDQAAPPGHGGAAGQDQGGTSSRSGTTSLQGTGGETSGGGATFTFGDPNGPGIARLVWPEYPREARRLGKAGTVILKLSLDASGQVDAVEILRSAGFGMEEAAREAALRSRFRPATLNGRPVACQAILPLHFQLR